MPPKRKRPVLQSDLAEAFEQVSEGRDIPGPRRLLSRITAADAATKLPGAPYSILDNLAHADPWQRIFLAPMLGTRSPSYLEDWKEHQPADWEGVRKGFLERFEAARRLAAEGFDKADQAKTDSARARLIQTLIHDAYHLGQINLLKRMLRAHKAGRSRPGK
ncbi:MAG: hypothetical protein HND42_04170 [Armatimonadetes bacterium]|nr:hypothetical protein [Armatimonadota bacterium]NOG92428.1 hypothetical protein [Armatimonadota bacterium]